MKVKATQLTRQRTAVRRVLNQLRGTGRLRKLISKECEDRLGFLAELFPNQTRQILKNLLFFHQANMTPTRIKVAKNLHEPRNRKLLKCLAGSDYELLERFDSDGVLDLSRGAKIGKLGYEDLTKNFKDYQTLKVLRQKFFIKAENPDVKAEKEFKDFVTQDPEFSNLVLFHLLWKVRTLIYRAGEIRSLARQNDDLTTQLNTQAFLINAADFLNDVCDHLPIRVNGMKNGILQVAGLIRRFNTPAANSKLVRLSQILENVITARETRRIIKERSSGIKEPANLIEEELTRLAKRRYKISISPDGIWVIPQAGYRPKGPVRRKQIINPHVPAEKVERRTQHIIDGISQEIAVNAGYLTKLKALAKRLDSAELPVNYQALLLDLNLVHAEYARGIVREKQKIVIILEAAIDLVKAASRSINGEKRLLRFTAAILFLATSALNERNRILLRQLQLMLPKQELLDEIIASNIRRDTHIRSFVEILKSSLTNKKMMNSTYYAARLRRLATDMKRTILSGGYQEEGIQCIAARLKDLVFLLNSISKQIQRKNKCRDILINLRLRWQIEIKRFRALERHDRVPPYKRYVLDTVRERLGEIRRLNDNINQSLAAALKEALLIQYDLQHKYEKENAVASMEFLEGYTSLFDAVVAMDAEYLTVLSRDGEILCQAHVFDVRKLGLRTLEEV
jgi:hypothetical protein